MQLKRNYAIVIFGFIEIGIGLITLVAVITSFILGKSIKPLEVLIFVLTTSILSLSLGIGILRHNLVSYRLLLFFAAVIILSKILIFAKLITLAGALETHLYPGAKNTISIIYHSLLIWYFIHPAVKKQFTKTEMPYFLKKPPF